ncbi:MAG: electron transfer flavoprotein subunit alpha/FixB family protein [Desulfatiglandaceae bacterium]
MSEDICILVQHREGVVEEPTFGLIGEARRIIQQRTGEGKITAVVLGPDQKLQLNALGAYGADRVLQVCVPSSDGYQAELFAKILFRLMEQYKPSCVLVAQTPETSDLCSRVAALLETGFVTWAVDLNIDEEGRYVATRPVANGYLFENVCLVCESTPIISFLPSVLTSPEPESSKEVEILVETVEEEPGEVKARMIEIIEAEPGDLDIEEADIIIAGGRGVGRDDAFQIIHELASQIAGSVAGTRPVIDWQTLPYDRQIGQTGKTVAPRLIINCGISGANEFTAGMEKSQLVIAINTDPRARIFRFADLGVIGDVHQILPLLINRLNEIKESMD